MVSVFTLLAKVPPERLRVLFLLPLMAVLLAINPVYGQFGSILKSAKDKAKQTAGQEINKSVPPAQPSSSPQQAGATQAPTPQPAPAPQPAANASGGKVEPWPGLQLDPELLAQQQVELKKFCESKNSPKITNCDCMVSRYPAWRLSTLSADIRLAKQNLDRSCSADPGAPECANLRQRFESLQTKEAQDILAPGKVFRGKPVPVSMGPTFGRMGLTEHRFCTDNASIAERAESECLRNAESGMVKVEAGKSTKGYCACIKSETLRAYEEQQPGYNSNSSVNIQSAAYVACQAK